MMVPVSYYLVVSAILFTMGALGVLIRRNALVIFMSIELMLNAANLAFVAFARMYNVFSGQIVRLLRDDGGGGGSGGRPGADRDHLPHQAQHQCRSDEQSERIRY